MDRSITQPVSHNWLTVGTVFSLRIHTQSAQYMLASSISITNCSSKAMIFGLLIPTTTTSTLENVFCGLWCLILALTCTVVFYLLPAAWTVSKRWLLQIVLGDEEWERGTHCASTGSPRDHVGGPSTGRKESAPWIGQGCRARYCPVWRLLCKYSGLPGQMAF